MENSDNKINYHVPAMLDEQIALAEMELADFEKQCAAKINFRRGAINALQLIKQEKPLIAKMPN